MTRFLKGTNRGILYGVMCLLLAPLACQVREAGEQRIEEAPAPAAFTAKVVKVSDKINDYAFELSWNANYPVEITKTFPWKSPKGEIMPSTQVLSFEAGTNHYLDNDKEELFPGTTYTFYIAPKNEGDPKILPESIEIKLPEDILLSTKYLIQTMGTALVHQILTPRLFFSEDDHPIIIGGDYRITADEVQFGKNGRLDILTSLLPEAYEWERNIRGADPGPGSKSTIEEHYRTDLAQFRLFARKATGNLNLTLERTGKKERKAEIFIRVEDNRDFQLNFLEKGPALEQDIKAVLGGKGYRYDNGRLEPIDRHVGIYRNKKNEKIPFYFVAFDGGCYPIEKRPHGSADFVYQPAQSKLSSKIDGLPGNEYEKLRISGLDDAQIPPNLRRLMEAHRLAVELNNKLVQEGYVVEFYFSENRYDFSDEQFRFIEYLTHHAKEFAAEMAKSPVKRVLVTNDRTFVKVPTVDQEQSRLEITSDLPRTARENYQLAIEAMRNFKPNKLTYR